MHQDEIDDVAKRMCGELGLAESESVHFPRADMQSPGEQYPVYHPPQCSFNPDWVNGPRWWSYRRQAALAIAAWRAVNAQVLIEG